MMPDLGEIKRVPDIGRVGRGHKYIWTACEDCGKGRWVRYNVQEMRPRDSLCHSCGQKKGGQSRRGESNWNWKDGKTKTAGGYILVKLQPDDFFYPMAQKDGYVREHRLLMAKHLGRCLQPWEIVHHKNGIKDDNRWENFEMTIRGSHSIEHSKGYRDGYQKGLVDGRNQQIKELRDEVKLLQWQIKELAKVYRP